MASCDQQLTLCLSVAMNADPRPSRIGYGSGVKWRVLVWAAVVIAAAAAAAVLLGVVAVSAGLTAASGLAGVIVGFCELVAVALAVIGLAGERRSAVDTGRNGRVVLCPQSVSVPRVNTHLLVTATASTR